MNFKVVIDAGHGGEDAGATNGNVYEKDLTLQIAKYMYDQFQKKGIPVTIIRNTDETVSPEERVRRILNAYGNNSDVVVISNHINAGGGEGAEVIYALRNNSNLASNVLTALGNKGLKMRKYYQRRLPSDTSKDYYFIHRNTGKTEPIIVEYGFIDNQNDLSKIRNNYQSYVDAVVDAVISTKQGQTVSPTIEGNTYTVKKGDSLWSIATKYNTTVDELKKLNDLTSNVLQTGQVLMLPATETNNNTYIVQKGDSLWSIAKKYNTDVNTLKALNNLTSTNLSIGQILNLPQSQTNTTNTYIVQKGDSLWSIAQKYNTDINTLVNLNKLTNNNLSIGQVLTLPTSTTIQPSTNTYTVKAGDSLWNIARRYNTDVDTLKRINGLSTNILSIGQVLNLPSSSTTAEPATITYTVKSGDMIFMGNNE